MEENICKHHLLPVYKLVEYLSLNNTLEINTFVANARQAVIHARLFLAIVLSVAIMGQAPLTLNHFLKMFVLLIAITQTDCLNLMP
jgi:hypothetical protein